MIRLAILVVFIVIGFKIFNGGFEVKVNGEKYSLEVEQDKKVKNDK